MNKGIGNNVDQSEIQRKKKRGKQKFNLAADHIDIVETGQGDPNSIMRRMKMIEEQFMSNTALHDPALMKKTKNLQDQKAGANETASGEKKEGDGDAH